MWYFGVNFNYKNVLLTVLELTLIEHKIMFTYYPGGILAIVNGNLPQPVEGSILSEDFIQEWKIIILALEFIIGLTEDLLTRTTRIKVCKFSLKMSGVQVLQYCVLNRSCLYCFLVVVLEGNVRSEFC